MAGTSTRRRHEVRDENGHLLALIDEVIDEDSAAATMIELACDLPGRAYRVRLFPAARERVEPPRRAA